MKRLGLLLTIFTLLTLTAFSAPIDKTTWYKYNGYATAHSFSVLFPPTWKARTFGNDLQSFAPSDEKELTYFSIQEFEGYTYSKAINSYKDANTSLISQEDVILSFGGDLVGKVATYNDAISGTEFKVTFIKRGSLIVALTNPAENEFKDLVTGIYESFTFTDNWHQYIDYGDKYTFIFPSSLEINTVSGGVKVVDPLQFSSEIFKVLKYQDVSLASAPQESELTNENFLEKTDIAFHGITPAISATFENISQKKKFSRIFIEKNGSSFGMTNTNIEENYPHLNYYDAHIIEMLESFEFFNVEGDFYSYVYFPDVRDNHSNAKSINALTKSKVINGYPDGTFKPDGEINRAELTKMIVGTKMIPSVEDYNNCFDDVSDQWFAPYVCYAKEQNWVMGYGDGTFKPEQNINRVEAIKIVLEVLFSNLPENEILKDTSVLDVTSGEWYERYYNFADNRDLLDMQHATAVASGFYYHPEQNMTRKEVAEMIYRSSTKLLLP